MKKICRMAIIAIVICVCWSQTIGAIEITLPDKVTIDYNGHRVDITFNGNVELGYIFSFIDEEALTWEVYKEYNSTVDQVVYSFWSEEYFPGYWEKLDQELFIFQDNNSKELFLLRINMSGVEIPEDPWKMDFINISSEYNETYQELLVTIFNLTKTKEELDELMIEYTDIFQELNITALERENLTFLMSNKLSEINRLKNDLNTSEDNLLIASNDATTYRRFFDEMTSFKSSFDFRIAGRSEQYITIYEYEHDLDKLNSQVGGIPILIFFSVTITGVICFLIGYWKWAKKRSSPEEVEMYEGVDRTTTFVNRFKSRLNITPKNVKVKEVNKETRIEEIQPKEKEKTIDERFLEINDKVNDKIKGIETKIDTNHSAILKQLEQLTGFKKKVDPNKE